MARNKPIATILIPLDNFLRQRMRIAQLQGLAHQKIRIDKPDILFIKE